MTPRNTSGLFPQLLLDVNDELIVDLFAGGGGASLGIEMATGRQVDVAVNHDPIAVALHQANHPQTLHETCDVFEVDPREVTKGRPVGLLWASPDCTDHSKAKGGKPFRESARKRRALAWVVTRWAGQVRPRVIALENVEEFQAWSPLIGSRDELRRDPNRKGQTFRQWKRSLEQLGYVVEHREIRACDFGAPTIRKRLYVIARCDGRPIVWPEATHGPKTKRPFRTAAECIDWSVPMLSIFATREEARAWGKALGQAPPVRPLAEATMRRIARGVKRFVLDAAKPFIVTLNHSGGREHAPRGLDEPMRTLAAARDAHGLLAPSMVHIGNGERTGQAPRALNIHEPLNTVVGSPKHALVGAFLAKHFGGVVGSPLDEPKGTVTTIDHDSLVAAHIKRDFADSVGHAAGAPLGAVTEDGHASLVASFLQKYYGTGTAQDQALTDPLHTIPTHDRFGLVTVTIDGALYYIADIAMRMLRPRELFNAQGFPAAYRIQAQVWDAKKKVMRSLTQSEQVRLVGNSVCPDIACALVRANCPELRARDEVAA